MKPALPPEEWARRHHLIQCYDSWDDREAKSGVGEVTAGPDYLTLSSKNGSEIGDFSAPSDRHALAALALYGQPFGFTAEDVALLRDAAEAMYADSMEHSQREEGERDRARVLALAERLAALLPLEVEAPPTLVEDPCTLCRRSLEQTRAIPSGGEAVGACARCGRLPIAQSVTLT